MTRLVAVNGFSERMLRDCYRGGRPVESRKGVAPYGEARGAEDVAPRAGQGGQKIKTLSAWRIGDLGPA